MGEHFYCNYVTTSTCAPSSAAIMTGRVQNRYSIETQIMAFYPLNMIESLMGKCFTNTGEFVLKVKPGLPFLRKSCPIGFTRIYFDGRQAFNPVQSHIYQSNIPAPLWWQSLTVAPCG